MAHHTQHFLLTTHNIVHTVKPVLSGHSKTVFQDQLSLTADQYILQYFRSSLSYHLPLRHLFVYFEWLLKTGFTVIEKISLSQNKTYYVLVEK